MTKRPLHIDGLDDRVFQHPIKGFVIRYDDQLACNTTDIGGEPGRSKGIYFGVEVFRGRCELGTWLTEQHPDDEHKLVNHLFVEAVFPIDFDNNDNTETQASLHRVDLAQANIDAGGACTICGQSNDGGVDHLVGCEVMSWLMYLMAQTITAHREPTLGEVVRAAEQQIARMK